MQRARSSLSRKRGTRKERPRILVVTEGTKTEPQYFRRLAQALRSTGVDVVGLDIVGVGEDPARVVREAADRAHHKGNRRGERLYDRVWCVVDVDSHKSLEVAMREAARFGINIAITNPCFEVWLVWHYQDLTKPVTPKDASYELRAHGWDSKNIPSSFPIGNYLEAISRSHHQRNVCEPAGVPDNPGSTVCELVLMMSP